MKTLSQFLSESMIQEAFKSSVIRDVILSLDRRGKSDVTDGLWGMQWDKITDNDIKQLSSPEEGLKRARSRKNPGYVLWCGKNNAGVLYCKGITYGIDVITYSYTRGNYHRPKLYDISDSNSICYELLDPRRFESFEMRQQRKKSQKGALALRDCDAIRDENINRYQQALAKMHTPDAESLIPEFERISEMYKQCVDMWVKKYVAEMQTDSPMFFKVGDAFEKINTTYKNIAIKMMDVAHWRDNGGNWGENMHTYALDSYKLMSKLIKDLEVLVTDYLEGIK